MVLSFKQVKWNCMVAQVQELVVHELHEVFVVFTQTARQELDIHLNTLDSGKMETQSGEA